MNVNFSDLKRKQVKKIFDNGIEIYNPDKEQKNEIFDLVFRNIEDSNQAMITGRQLLLKLIPMLTNIHLDLENEKLIEEIMDDPSDELLAVQDEINDIVETITNRAIDAAQKLSKTPEHIRNQILKDIEPVVDPKIKEIQELETKLRLLKGE